MYREKILCVDDEDMVVDALKMELIRGLSPNIVIETAGSAEEALQIAEETINQGDKILLVISDQRMPGMTGEILLSKIDKLLPKALKILLTGYTDIEAVQYAINNAGLFRYIQKPWDREDLILTVNQAVDKYRTQECLDEKTDQIVKINEGLEKTVERRTLQLSEAIKELEAFTYTVSHDLKSPLRTIDYYSKYILEDYSNELNSDVTDMIKNIREVCGNMFELIDKLLQYFVTAKADLELSSVDMGVLVGQTFQQIITAEENRNIELLSGDLPTVKGDPILLKQVVYNLLSNAVKFTRKTDKAIIKVNFAQDEKQYSFSISDNGVGFNMEYASKVFGIFERFHSQNDFEGSGIGLATVKKIVEKHGGIISIDSRENRGTTVSFSLPKAL